MAKDFFPGETQDAKRGCQETASVRKAEASWANHGSWSPQMGLVEGSEKRSFSPLEGAWRKGFVSFSV